MPQSTQQKLQWTGDKIKDLRQRLAWSQAELARRLGCRQQTVSEWETDVYLPQNAYSQLLDRIFEEAQNYTIQTRKLAQADVVLNERKVTQVSNDIIEESPSSSFDSFID